MSWLCLQTSAVLQPRLFSVTPSTSQILFLSGLTFIIGLRRTAHFFFQRHKFRGSFFFLGGVSLVLCRWPIIGMLVESYGFVLLFRSFFPMAVGFVLSALNIPYLSTYFSSSSSMV
ncbi:vesicle transport protein GOT1A isoform X3 [Cynoglossus semilaevis]|uniref:vesicle transport protein GOT1A isoform X3 n=1 Tax=Cynoglossus semilaevis TaxID=244447 RepID=UPI000D628EC7|nr:vesicle transport protein GOT1A isoform X3 [Cynoglossus semilaevis]